MHKIQFQSSFKISNFESVWIDFDKNYYYVRTHILSYTISHCWQSLPKISYRNKLCFLSFLKLSILFKNLLSGFDNYHKSAVRDHVRILKFWRTLRTSSRTKKHNQALCFLPSDFPKKLSWACFYLNIMKDC